MGIKKELKEGFGGGNNDAEVDRRRKHGAKEGRLSKSQEKSPSGPINNAHVDNKNRTTIATQNKVNGKSKQSQSVPQPQKNHKIVRTASTRTRRKYIIDSPTRKLNKRLVNLVRELRTSNDFYKHELKKAKGSSLDGYFELQEQNEALSRENVKLSKHNEKLREMCRLQENKDVSLAKSKTLSKENHELLNDLDVSKSVVCRLNKELMLCQEKLQIQGEMLKGNGTIHEDEGSPSFDACNGESTTSSGQKQQNLEMRNPRKNLFPLLVAYDEVIQEKNEIIRDLEKALKQFKSRCKNIVKENEDLYEIISKRQEQGTVSIEEWQVLHSNSLIVLEENEILQSKLELLKNKEDAMMKSHREKSYQMKMKISALEEEKSLLQSAVTKSDSHCKKLLDQLSKMSDMIEKRIPIDQHEASVRECKLLFEELRVNYNEERSVLLEKVDSCEKEKNRLINEVAELEAGNARLQATLKTCEDTLTRNTVQFREVYNRMTDATKARDATNYAMEETMELSQRLVADRDNVEHLLQEQRTLNENLLQMRGKQIELVNELQHKIKEMENVHAMEIDKLLRNLRDYEIRKDGISGDLQQKIICIESLVEEKSKRIEHLEAEKRQLQTDLETVWKTTTTAMKDMATSR